MFHSRTLFPTWKANPGLPPKDRRRARLEALAGVRSISSCIPCFPSLFILSRISQDTVKIMQWSTWRKEESPFLFLFFCCALVKYPSALRECSHKHDWCFSWVACFSLLSAERCCAAEVLAQVQLLCLSFFATGIHLCVSVRKRDTGEGCLLQEKAVRSFKSFLGSLLCNQSHVSSQQITPTQMWGQWHFPRGKHSFPFLPNQPLSRSQLLLTCLWAAPGS